jgi:hypothetical protein
MSRNIFYYFLFFCCTCSDWEGEMNSSGCVEKSTVESMSIAIGGVVPNPFSAEFSAFRDHRMEAWIFPKQRHKRLHGRTACRPDNISNEQKAKQPLHTTLQLTPINAGKPVAIAGALQSKCFSSIRGIYAIHCSGRLHFPALIIAWVFYPKPFKGWVMSCGLIPKVA